MGTYNYLTTDLKCPRCGMRGIFKICCKFGYTGEMVNLHLGDEYPWDTERRPWSHALATRPPDGTVDDGFGYSDCPSCGCDIDVNVQVVNDRIVGARPEYDSTSWTPDGLLATEHYCPECRERKGHEVALYKGYFARRYRIGDIYPCPGSRPRVIERGYIPGRAWCGTYEGLGCDDSFVRVRIERQRAIAVESIEKYEDIHKLDPAAKPAEGPPPLTPEQQALAEYMDELSREQRLGDWDGDLAFDLWAELENEPAIRPRKTLPPGAAEELRELSAACGGWVCRAWCERDTRLVWFPREEWLRLHEAYRPVDRRLLTRSLDQMWHPDEPRMPERRIEEADEPGMPGCRIEEAERPSYGRSWFFPQIWIPGLSALIIVMVLIWLLTDPGCSLRMTPTKAERPVPGSSPSPAKKPG